MADPTPYSPSYSFTGWQNSNPAKPLPATRADNEFENIDTAIAGLVSAVKDIRRSDGALKNGLIGPDQLSPALTIGFTNRGEWADGASYASGDGVVYGSAFYSARAQHTAAAGTRPDLSPATWRFLFSITNATTPDNSFSGLKLMDGTLVPAKFAPGVLPSILDAIYPSMAAFRAATIPAIIGSVTIQGYYGPNTTGGGKFYADATDTTSNDNGGTVIVKDGKRWKRPTSPFLSPYEFGAKGDGVSATEDTAAMLAIAALQRPRVIIAGAGDFLLNQKITFSDFPTSIFGAGQRITNFIWNTSVADGGFSFRDNLDTNVKANDRSHFTVKDMSLLTKRVHGGGTAIYVNCTATNPSSPYGLSPTVTIKDVEIRGYDWVDFGWGSMTWDGGVHVVDTGGVVLNGVNFCGIQAPYAPAFGFRIESLTSPQFKFYITACDVWFAESAIHFLCASDYNRLEGIYISQMEIVACRRGLYAQGGTVNALHFYNGHIDGYENCVLFSDQSESASDLRLEGIYFGSGQLYNGLYAPLAIMVDLPNPNYGSITNCYFSAAIQSDRPGTSHFGIRLRSAVDFIVSGNTFLGVDGGAFIEELPGLGFPTNNLHVFDNVFRAVPADYVVSGARVNTTVRQILEPRHFSGSELVTLDANGDGVIPVAIQLYGGQMRGPVVCNGDKNASPERQFIAGSVSGTNLSFSVRPNPGAVLVRVNFSVMLMW